MQIKNLFSTRRRIAAVVLSGAVVLGAAGVAAAYFTATGTGTGTATVGTSTAWTVQTTGTTGSALLPGSGSQTVAFTITNESSGGQAITAVDATITTGALGCTASWFTVSAAPPASGIGAAIPGGGSTTDTVTVSLNTSGGTQDACKSVHPTVTLHVS